MTTEIRPRCGGTVHVEEVTEGFRLTCTDFEDDEIAVVYLSAKDAARLADALRVQSPGQPGARSSP